MNPCTVIDFRSRRHVEMTQATETYLRGQLAIAQAENATLCEVTRHLADQVAALKRWRLRALFCAPWLNWVVRMEGRG